MSKGVYCVKPSNLAVRSAGYFPCKRGLPIILSLLLLYLLEDNWKNFGGDLEAS